ncbi:hypothetical protein ACS0TY_004381 [Phlomoides rotata]
MGGAWYVMVRERKRDSRDAAVAVENNGGGHRTTTSPDSPFIFAPSDESPEKLKHSSKENSRKRIDAALLVFDRTINSAKGLSSEGISWPSSNKVSILPQFMSLKCEQDERPSKNGNLFSTMSPFLKTHCMGANLKFGGGPMKQQLHGGNVHTALPSAASMVGTTEQWLNKSKASQLTIFYGGTVNVFDDISPEKAQAIIFLAGNAYVKSNMTQSKLHMQTPTPKHPASYQTLVLCMNVPGLLSPVSVSSHPADQSGANNDDVKVSKTVGMPTILVNKAEPPRVMPSIGPVGVSAIISSAVPQARKASLARFLEKRKERKGI